MTTKVRDDRADFASLEGTPAYESCKQEQRYRVARFFAANVAAGRILVMPGSWWSFEHTLDALTGERFSYCGVERVWSVMHNSLASIPGSVGTLRHSKTSNSQHSAAQAFETDRARVTNCELLELLTAHRRLGRTAFQVWSLENGNYSAAWLDLCGQLCGKTVKAVYELGYNVDPDADRVPVAVTLRVGREPAAVSNQIMQMELSGEGAAFEDSRAEIVRRAFARHPLRRFTPGERWTYMSGRSRMCVITGFLDRP